MDDVEDEYPSHFDVKYIGVILMASIVMYHKGDLKQLKLKLINQDHHHQQQPTKLLNLHII